MSIDLCGEPDPVNVGRPRQCVRMRGHDGGHNYQPFEMVKVDRPLMCMDSITEDLKGFTYQHFCTREPGHEGAHRGASGAEWPGPPKAKAGPAVLPRQEIGSGPPGGERSTGPHVTIESPAERNRAAYERLRTEYLALQQKVAEGKEAKRRMRDIREKMKRMSRRGV